ncbi:MAG: hypothetical protein LBU32_24020 [Clostridiales bacterium]|jgi:hypothetical protein|nr:hypothetical protein [Clostridiales bacterium]
MHKEEFLNKPKSLVLLKRSLEALAIDKGTPVEQAQRLLGHEKLEVK